MNNPEDSNPAAPAKGSGSHPADCSIFGIVAHPELFAHMEQDHGMSLTEGEMNEIADAVERDRKLSRYSGKHTAEAWMRVRARVCHPLSEHNEHF